MESYRLKKGKGVIMYKSKKYFYTYEDYDEGDKSGKTLIEEIMNDSEFAGLDEIVIGCWGECWDPADAEDGAQAIIDGIVANKDKFSHIKSLFVGDMDFEECEVSWIVQANYSKLWAAMPQLEKLVIKGSCDLTLGEIASDSLKHLEIICGGLPASVIKEIQQAKAPNLETLLLYLGVEDYGFDAEPADLENLLSESDFPKLSYLGLTDSENQNEIAEMILNSKYISQITTLDLSNGTLTDEGGQLLLDKIPEYPNIKELNLEYHFMSEEMMDKLADLEGVDVCVDDPQEADEYDGEVYYYPMLTE